MCGCGFEVFGIELLLKNGKHGFRGVEAFCLDAFFKKRDEESATPAAGVEHLALGFSSETSIEFDVFGPFTVDLFIQIDELRVIKAHCR
jgi:hypothetical protein